MKHASYSLLFIFESLYSSTMSSFINHLHVLWYFSLAGTNSVIVVSMHDATLFILIFLHACNSFFIVSLELCSLSTSIIKVSLTKLFSSYSLLLLSLLFPSMPLFYSALFTFSPAGESKMSVVTPLCRSQNHQGYHGARKQIIGKCNGCW